MSPPRLSGLQRQVLHFYRDVLRAAKHRQSEDRQVILTYARSQFERYRGVDRKNYQLIEHLLRKGKRQIDLISQPDVAGVALHNAPRAEP